MTNSLRKVQAALPILPQGTVQDQESPSSVYSNDLQGRKDESIHSPQLPPSPVDSMNLATQAIDLTRQEGRRLTRDIDRGSPGDASVFSFNVTPEQRQLSKRKSQYYNDVFAYRESMRSARERVLKESIVSAEIRTNVIIKDEYTFITDFSNALSNRYRRSESSICVSVTHSVCILFAGTFDPTYILTITAVPSQVQPTTNKRNALLIQKYLFDNMGVDADRGIIKFISVPEENYAFSNKTVAGEIEDLEKEQGIENLSIKRSLSRHGSKPTSRLNMRSFRNLKAGKNQDPVPISPESDCFTPTLSARTPPLIPPMPTEVNGADRKIAQTQKMSRRKSFVQGLFKRSL